MKRELKNKLIEKNAPKQPKCPECGKMMFQFMLDNKIRIFGHYCRENKPSINRYFVLYRGTWTDVDIL